MSYPGLIYELGDFPESKQLDHEKYHVEEGIFEDGCGYCVYEKCYDCKGRGMDDKCNLCQVCNGRGRKM